MNALGIIQSIEEIHDLEIKAIAPHDGKGGRLGVMQMMGSIGGSTSMDGYKVKTSDHEFYVLIDNNQSCCEAWGYMASQDDLGQFIGSELLEINLTDTALNSMELKMSGFYGGEDENIQFVDFATNTGTFQLAVYNGHNGYYGHGILIAKDQEILLNDTI